MTRLSPISLLVLYNYALNGPEPEVKSRKQIASPKADSSLLKRVARGAVLTAAAGASTIASPMLPEVEARDNVVEHEVSTVNFAKEAWAPLKIAVDKGERIESIEDHHIPMNRLIMALSVSDTTAIKNLDEIRYQILEAGKDERGLVPPELVHVAMFTLAEEITQVASDKNEEEKQRAALNELLKAIQDKEIKEGADEDTVAEAFKTQEQIDINNENIKELEGRLQGFSKAIPYLRPYIGVAIVDTREITFDSNSKQTISVRRKLVPASDAGSSDPKDRTKTVYNGNNFSNLAAHVIALVGNRENGEKVLENLQAVGNNTERRDSLWTMLAHTRPESELPQGAKELFREYVYGKDYASETTPNLNKNGKVVIPEVPDGTSTGSVEKLMSDIGSYTVVPPLSYPASKSDFAASNMLTLAKRGDFKYAFPAACQWFAIKPKSESSSEKNTSSYENKDYQALQVIALAAQQEGKRGKEAFKVLSWVMASFPDFALEGAFKVGSSDTGNNEWGKAYVELRKAFKAHPHEAEKLIKDLINKKAELIWEADEESSDIISARKIGRAEALRIAAFLLPPEKFVDEFRAIVVDNPYPEEGTELNNAMSGLALARDKKSIPALLRLGVEARNDSTRVNALNAALKAASYDHLPKEVRNKLAEKSPLMAANPQYCFPGLLDESKKSSKELESPFVRFAELSSRRFVANAEGKSASEVSIENVGLDVYGKFVSAEFAGGEDVLQDAICSGSVDGPIRGMISYIKSCRGNGNLNPFIAFPMIDILGKSGCGSMREEAKTLFEDMVVNPRMYIKPISHNCTDCAGKRNENVRALELNSIAALANLVSLDNPDDKGTELLLAFVRGGSAFEENQSLSAIYDLGVRFDKEIAKVEKEDQNKANSYKETRAKLALKFLEKMKDKKIGPFGAADHEDRSLMRRDFDYAQALVKLGGDKGVEIIFSEIDKWSHEKGAIKGGSFTKADIPRTPFVLSFVQAVLAEGYKEKDIKALNLDEGVKERSLVVFDFVRDQEFYFGERENRENIFNQPARKDVAAAVIDVGFGLPIGTLNPIIPSACANSIKPTDFSSLHPTHVSYNLAQTLDYNIPIVSLNANQNHRTSPFRPEVLADNFFITQEILTEAIIDGTYPIVAANYSIGWDNNLLSDIGYRRNHFALIAASMELQEKIGVLSHTIAAGNNHDDTGKKSEAWDSRLGDISSYGSYISDDGSVTPVPSATFASAMYPFTSSPFLVDFSGRMNPANVHLKLGDQVFSFPGVQNLSETVSNGSVKMRPVDGTSFGAPPATGHAANTVARRNDAGLLPLSPAEYRQVQRSSSKRIPRVKDHEGGRYLDVPLFKKQSIAPRKEIREQIRRSQSR